MGIKNNLITELSYLKTGWKRKLISISKTFKGQYGLEIGGPSSIVLGLKGVIPIYIYAKGVDGVNFSTNTVWEGQLSEGKTYKYFQKHVGHQYIAEGTNLSEIENGKYDFILSSHSLEHVSNPLKALMEWNRVIRKTGRLVLILPDKTKTFDRNRSYTKFTHLLEDFKNGTDEYDKTHLQEILELHDFTYEQATNKEEFKQKLADNFTHRMVHHHVFSFDLIKEMLNYTGFKTVYQQACPPFHLVTIAEKMSGSSSINLGLNTKS